MNYEMQPGRTHLAKDYAVSKQPTITVAQQMAEFEEQLRQGKSNWLADWVGQWPGAETDEEFEQLLKDLD